MAADRRTEAATGTWPPTAGIFAFGDAALLRLDGWQHLNRPIVGMAATRDGKGYWEVASDGGVFAFGDAGFHGSTGNIHLNQPVVGMAATPDGDGYWLVASDGGIFSFGDAAFHGSTGNIHLNQPVVGMAATPERQAATGWWPPTVASSPSATPHFHGSTGNIHLNQPMVGMASTPDGRATGWWPPTAASSPSATPASTDRPATSGWPSRWWAWPPTAGNGYWMVASDGGLFAFGSAPFYGSMPQVFAKAAVGTD